MKAWLRLVCCPTASSIIAPGWSVSSWGGACLCMYMWVVSTHRRTYDATARPGIPFLRRPQATNRGRDHIRPPVDPAWFDRCEGASIDRGVESVDRGGGPRTSGVDCGWIDRSGSHPRVVLLGLTAGERAPAAVVVCCRFRSSGRVVDDGEIGGRSSIDDGGGVLERRQVAHHPRDP